MFIKPNPNKKIGDTLLKVYDPAHRNFLPAEGREVPNNAYWICRLQTEDVVKVMPETQTAALVGKKVKIRNAKTKTTLAKEASNLKGE